MAAVDFSRRATTPELMDAADVPEADYRACLRDLETVNRLTLAYRPTLHFLDGLARGRRCPNDRPLRIVDVGCGGGDMLRRIRSWAARRGLDVALTGLDRDARAIAAARAATADAEIDWHTGAFEDLPDVTPVDLVVSSLFCHHLDDAALLAFLRWMERRAAIGWFVNDLHRHPLPHAVFRAWSRAAGWHRFVRHDGPVSITRAFVAADWRAALRQGGLPDHTASIRWHMPFRLCVSRVRPE
jgi:SAM-dependent methyltransferase